MIIALDASSPIGERTSKTLLGDPRCELLVLLGSEWFPQNTRVLHSNISDSPEETVDGKTINHIDVVVSDGTSPPSLLRAFAALYCAPLVLWPDVRTHNLGVVEYPVVVGANVISTLPYAILEHPSSNPGELDSVTLGWTEIGTPLESGKILTYPEPVGTVWAEELIKNRFVAYREDEWTGVTTIVSGPEGIRIVGVSDHREHLEALTLSAVTFAALAGSFTPGVQRAQTSSREVLHEAEKLELDLAVWVPDKQHR